MRISDWSSDVGSSDLKRGRKLGTLEEGFASTLSPGDTFGFAGLSLEVERIDTTEMIVRATSKSPRIPTYGGTRLALSTNLAARVRRFLHEPEEWWRFPDDVREWLEVQGRSEEHTSELQSLMRISYAVFFLKQKTKTLN